MLSFFQAGSHLVQWEITAVERDGPFRLAVRHAHGVIVEYFEDADAALNRQRDLEQLLIAAATHGRAAPRDALAGAIK